MLKTKGGIFLFNIIPSYRPGMRKVFDYGFYELACVPSIAQRCKQNTLYTSLENIAGESLVDLDLLYVMATDGTRVFAAINWVDPGNFSFTENGTVTFTELQGFTGDGSTGYLDTGWAPDPDGVNFTQNEGGAFCSVKNNPSSTLFAFGCRGTAGNANDGQLVLLPNTTTSQHNFSVSSPGASIGSSVSPIGFFHIHRTGVNTSSLYKDGALVGSNANTSTAMTTRTVVLLAFNINSGVSFFAPYQLGCFGIGASLTGKESALNTAWNTYFTSI